MRIARAIVGLTLLVAAGCGDPFEEIESADRVTLYSLVPYEPGERAPRPDEEWLDGYRVIGKTELDAADRKRIAAAFRQGVASNDGMAAACFQPRHAV